MDAILKASKASMDATLLEGLDGSEPGGLEGLVWRFWPPQEFGSSLAQGPDMSAIAELQEAIIAASAWLEEQPE